MNSEELEKSLRLEFDAYLSKVIAKMREDAVEFQKKIEAEFDSQRTQLEEQRARLGESFREFSARYEGAHQFDAGFSETVVEHLRLSRDEGAQIAANAIAEAEQLSQPEVVAAAPAAADFSKLNDAIKDISAQHSQATILKSLVSHASEFARRGAFFIVKNQHFVGWKTLDESEDEAVQDIEFPISSSSLLGRAVNSLSTADGSYDPDSEDRAFLEPLRFGQPDKMYAIPLTARGRGVAVLYVDRGAEGRDPDLGALEALVRVAGMTVELQAAAKQAAAAPVAAPQEVKPAAPVESPAPAVAEKEATDFSFTESAPEGETAPESFAKTEETFEPRGFDTEIEAAPAVAEEAEVEAEVVEAEVVEAEPEIEEFRAPASDDDFAEPAISSEPIPEFQPSFGSPAPSFMDAGVVTAPVAGVAVEAPRARLSNRNVDLPIEVAEDERRLHNDARRFARLLVSEIKLYNEQKVKEGRESSDLYDRLREAVDRSREMYDKRVQPPVAAKFDYFDYELVNSLADGDSARLGSSYPGPSK